MHASSFFIAEGSTSIALKVTNGVPKYQFAKIKSRGHGTDNKGINRNGNGTHLIGSWHLILLCIIVFKLKILKCSCLSRIMKEFFCMFPSTFRQNPVIFNM
jgi:hypothetical protein